MCNKAIVKNCSLSHENAPLSFHLVCRYSAIRCASAVPMSSLELQQAPSTEPENKNSGMNGDVRPTSKPSAKPQKGIMGMFANTATSKNQESSKEIKSEQREERAVVWPGVLLAEK